MADIHRYEAKLRWTGAARGPTRSYAGYARDYLIEIPGKPPLAGSADVAFRGDPARHNPEDLLVAALSACHLLTYLPLCARAGIEVLAYADRAGGTMTLANGKMRFTEVLLRPEVTIGKGDLDRARALHEQAHGECFIANSVSFPVRNQPTVRRAQSVAAE